MGKFIKGKWMPTTEKEKKTEARSQQDKAKMAKCKGKKGAALDACLKAAGRKLGKTGEWEKIRNETSSSDRP